MNYGISAKPVHGRTGYFVDVSRLTTAEPKR